MKRSYEMDLCSGPLLSKILLFSLPLILSGVLQLLFNATDIVVVGKFAGSNAMAAVGSTTSLFNLLVNSFIGISVGANVLVARHYGERDYDGVQQTIQTALLTGLIGGHDTDRARRCARTSHADADGPHRTRLSTRPCCTCRCTSSVCRQP